MKSLPANGQVVNDGATATLNHVTNSITGGVTIGTNGSFTLLILTNAALLTNSGTGVIGLNAGANSNSVRLTGLNSGWLIGQDLSVGSGGSANHLVISNGARVDNNYGALGIDPTSSNNDAIVTGTGSLWSNRNDCYVGYGGHGNRLIVTNGGLVEDASGRLGVDALSSNNQVLITGPGSLWTNRASLFVGFGGSGNQLIVSNGAVASTSNNFILGSSPGSVSNFLLLSRGATLTNRNNGIIGAGSGANGNLAFLSDTNTSWLIRNTLQLGSNGSLNRLVVSNGAQLVSSGGNVGLSAGSSNNQLVITGPGSRCTIPFADMTFGVGGSANSLVVSNGGAMFDSDGGAGAVISSSNNLIWITGTGSSWTNSGSCFFGESGPGNLLVVTNGGTVSVGLSLTVGLSVSSSNNQIILDGGNLYTTNALIGSLSGGNRLAISNNGAFFGNQTVLGASASSSNNDIVVDGALLIATNAAGRGALDVRRGISLLNSGRIETDRLLLTNNAGTFEFYGGLLITHGAYVSNGLPFVVGLNGASPAIWDVRAGPTSHFIAGSLEIGGFSSFNQLFITNGAALTNGGDGILGYKDYANSNSVVLSGAGSRWVIGTDLRTTGAANQLVVSNGAYLQFETGGLGLGLTSSNNIAVVTDSGSIWNSLVFTVGALGPANQLIVSNAGAVFCNAALIGSTATSTNNRLVIDGGSMSVTNLAATGYLSVQRGTNVLNAGWMNIDWLLITNSAGLFEFNGGQLFSKATTNSNGRAFNLGNGSSTAAMTLVNGNFHSFANGLVVRSNATLAGIGTLLGAVTVQNGGALSPGTSLGVLTMNSPPILQGRCIMEIANNGLMLPNDQIQVAGTLTYGGSLIVTNLGPGALNAGDEFFLFNAPSYSGSFSSITLPPLAAGLTWTNKLLSSGSIQVIGPAPRFKSIVQSGTNVLISGSGGTPGTPYWVLTSTNVNLLLSNWARLLTNQFDAGGNFIFTNAISPAVPRRFYRLQLP